MRESTVCPRPGRGLLGPGMTSQRRGELEQVIGEVAASYGAGRLIDSLSSAQLPNKRQVIEALNHLKARSEERRVGKECRSRCIQKHNKKTRNGHQKTNYDESRMEDNKTILKDNK